MAQEKLHSILDRPWEYSIHEIRWGATDGDPQESYFEVLFVKSAENHRLRFLSPQEVRLELSGGFPQSCGELVIHDISDRGWDGLCVQVAEGGASGSPLMLYARDVIEI